MKTSHQLINNIIGQLKGVDRMINEEKDCLEVVTQLKAVKSAVTSLMNKVVEQEFNYCMQKSTPTNKLKLKKILNNLIKKNS